MDNTTSWLNFAQLPVEQGGLGLQPHQAAGLVGNLVNESGAALPAWGPSGDNGTAWGTAQWRGDRLAALKAAYPDNYQTPEAQQAFMRSEFLGPENSAYKALLAAKSPEEAAGAVNHLYERSADNSGNRERAARQLMAQFGDAGGASPALSFANTDAEDDDTEDAKPALATNSVVGQGALTPQRIMNAEGSDNKLNSVAQGLTGIGAALAGISSPQQGYVLNAQLAQMKKDNESKYRVLVDKSGRILRYDQDGNVDMIGGSNPTGPTNFLGPTLGDPTLVKDANDPNQRAAFLKSISDKYGPNAAQTVSDMADYTYQPPTAAAIGRKDSPYPALFAAAKVLNPTLDMANYGSQFAGAKDWAVGGKSADAVKAGNQTLEHQGDALIESMKGLDNTQSPAFNSVKNWVNSQVLGHAGMGAFKTSAHAVADEMGKLFKGQGISDREIKQWEENLPDNMSPEQQRSEAKTLITLVKGGFDALEQKRLAALGPKRAAEAGPLIGAKAQAALQRIQDFIDEGGKPAAPAATVINHNAIDAELKRRGL